MKCPKCGGSMKFIGDGRHVCPRGCGEFLTNEATDEPTPQATVEVHVSQAWPELAKGTTGRMRQAMEMVAQIPLGTADVVGPCQGHGGKGGSRSKGGKSPARQKLEAWVRKTGPGRRIRSIRIGR